MGLLLGLFAVLVTPKEEEPQIDVTFADVYIPFPGATPAEVESLVTTPAEQVVSQIKGSIPSTRSLALMAPCWWWCSRWG